MRPFCLTRSVWWLLLAALLFGAPPLLRADGLQPYRDLYAALGGISQFNSNPTDALMEAFKGFVDALINGQSPAEAREGNREKFRQAEETMGSPHQKDWLDAAGGIVVAARPSNRESMVAIKVSEGPGVDLGKASDALSTIYSDARQADRSAVVSEVLRRNKESYLPPGSEDYADLAAYRKLASAIPLVLDSSPKERPQCLDGIYPELRPEERAKLVDKLLGDAAQALTDTLILKDNLYGVEGRRLMKAMLKEEMTGWFRERLDGEARSTFPASEHLFVHKNRADRLVEAASANARLEVEQRAASTPAVEKRGQGGVGAAGGARPSSLRDMPSSSSRDPKPPSLEEAIQEDALGNRDEITRQAMRDQIEREKSATAIAEYLDFHPELARRLADYSQEQAGLRDGLDRLEQTKTEREAVGNDASLCGKADALCQKSLGEDFGLLKNTSSRLEKLRTSLRGLFTQLRSAASEITPALDEEINRISDERSLRAYQQEVKNARGTLIRNEERAAERQAKSETEITSTQERMASLAETVFGREGTHSDRTKGMEALVDFSAARSRRAESSSASSSSTTSAQAARGRREAPTQELLRLAETAVDAHRTFLDSQKRGTASRGESPDRLDREAREKEREDSRSGREDDAADPKGKGKEEAKKKMLPRPGERF